MPDRIDNETDLIQTYLAPLAAGYPGALGLKDDVALLSVEPGTEIAVTTDPVIAGVHFFAADAPQDIAWKALACNISDLAAKGAEPFAYTMALAFPQAPERAWMAGFAEGLRAAQSAFGCQLAGGDTDRTGGPLSISITAFGKVPAGQAVRRCTARLSDHLFVSGTLGDSALGLDMRRDPGALGVLSQDERAHLVARYLRPRPRLELGGLLRAFASAALDISDGLVKDAARLAAPAGARAVLEAAALPLSPAARAALAHDPARLSRVLEGGDDYEILFAVPANQAAAMAVQAATLAVSVTRIGTLESGVGVRVLDAAGKIITAGAGGYDHFS